MQRDGLSDKNQLDMIIITEKKNEDIFRNLFKNVLWKFIWLKNTFL